MNSIITVGLLILVAILCCMYIPAPFGWIAGLIVLLYAAKVVIDGRGVGRGL